MRNTHTEWFHDIKCPVYMDQQTQKQMGGTEGAKGRGKRLLDMVAAGKQGVFGTR